MVCDERYYLSGRDKLRNTLERRLHYLYSGELTSTIVFIIVSYVFNLVFPNLHLYSLLSFWVSFFLLEFLLLQGTYYWYSKLRRLRTEKISITPIKTVLQLQKFKKLNKIVIVLAVLAFIVDFVKWYPSLPIWGIAVAVFIFIFAILEYINYFYIQLSYDNLSDIRYLMKEKKFKKSCISKDFERILYVDLQTEEKRSF